MSQYHTVLNHSAVMELSGNWWRSEVALEVHASLTERERARKRVFQGKEM